MTNTVYILAHAVTGVAYACFALLLALRGARTWLTGLLIAAVAATGAWALTEVAVLLGYVPLWSDPLANVLRDAAWLGLSLGLMFPRVGRTLLWRGLVAIAVLLTAFQIALDIGLLSSGSIAGVRIDGALIRLATTVLSLVLLENILRGSSPTEFWSVKHLVIGLLCICAFQLVSRIPEFLTHKTDPNMVIARPLVFLLVLPLFAVSSIRLPNMLLRVHSSRAFVFHSATLIVAGIMLQGLAVAAWYVRAYGGSNGTVLAVVLLFGGAAAIAVALVSGTLRSRVRRFINENFFNLKYDYRVEWEKVIRSLSLNPEQSSAQRVLRALCDLLDCHGGALWIHRASWRQFLPAAKLAFSSDFVPIPETDARLEVFRDSDRAFIALAKTDDALPAAALWRRDFASSWIVVPLRYRSMVVGLIVLAKPRAPRKLGWEDEGLIRLVGLQLGAYLVQEETAQSLADARQLEQFNKRFAFIVHDIKNTIGQLSLLVRNAAQFGHQQEFRDDMVVTLGNAVERLQELLKSLTLVGAESVPGNNSPEVIDLIMFLREFTKEKGILGQAVILNTEYKNLGLKVADSTSLRRVLEHVVANASDASDGNGPVEISVSKARESVQINVTDRGPGMTEAFIAEELFRPMRTTKGGGFGIGAYQARELMRDLGGDILVRSKIGEGTCVTLSLPLAEPWESQPK
jgi:putative PEP-CTERM system histidine kinase